MKNGRPKNAQGRYYPAPTPECLLKNADTPLSKPSQRAEYGAKLRRPRKSSENSRIAAEKSKIFPPKPSIALDTTQMFASIFGRKSPELEIKNEVGKKAYFVYKRFT